MLDRSKAIRIKVTFAAVVETFERRSLPTPLERPPFIMLCAGARWRIKKMQPLRTALSYGI